jgi:hypothetical protein
MPPRRTLSLTLPERDPNSAVIRAWLTDLERQGVDDLGREVRAALVQAHGLRPTLQELATSMRQLTALVERLTEEIADLRSEVADLRPAGTAAPPPPDAGAGAAGDADATDGASLALLGTLFDFSSA